jgi:hypothetical protein
MIFYDRMKHVPEITAGLSGIPLPPSSHAKPVNTFGPAKELELRRIVRGESGSTSVRALSMRPMARITGRRPSAWSFLAITTMSSQR